MEETHAKSSSCLLSGDEVDVEAATVVKVAYVVSFRGGRETGIHRKVAEQVGEWQRQGADTAIFVATVDRAVADWAELSSTVRVVGLRGHPVATLGARESLLRSVRQWEPDIVYSRQGLVHPGALWTASRVATVVEVNSNDVPEFRTTSRWRWRYSRATRNMLLRRLAGLVFVTDELSHAQDFAAGPSTRTTVSNPIRLSAYPQYPRPHNSNRRLFFIGHPGAPWHGLEHLLEIARAFPRWGFDVVGPEPEELPDRPANVVAHGTLAPEDYDSIMRRADVAIGTLGLYKKGMEEACPLKVREYLARGIPTIIGYHDSDFPEPTPFLLKLPNRSDGVESSIGMIADFVERSEGLSVPRASIAHLDVGEKERQRLRFLEQVASEARHH